MNVIVDTSAVIAVITNEKHKKELIKLTEGVELMAPYALHWEIGNAFSAMFKRKRIKYLQAISAIRYYREIPIRFIDIELDFALEIASKLDIYAYDAYFLCCASQHNSPLLSLDQKLLTAATDIGIKIIEVSR